MQIVSIPNLPEKRVNTAIASISIPIHKRIDPIKICCLVPSMAKHADLQVCHLDGNTVIVCPEAFDYYQRILFPLGFTVLCGKTKIGRTYPQDAAYNIARVGRVAFHNTKITDPVALDYFVEHNIPVVHVKQGYTKCSVVPVCEEAIITADKGIAHAARQIGFDVLEVLPGGVSLEGFPYGFLGGAAFLLDKKTMYFTGAVKNHPSKKEIYAFLKKYSIKIEEGSIPIPMDVGSVIPLLTE